MLKLDSTLRTAVDSAVLITGSARSGTTILGKLIHTYRNVEYTFEPPTLVALFSMLDIMPSEQWRFLYESYLAEDFLVNSMAGRSINMNRFDDSSVFAVKSSQEIERRLGRSWPKSEIMDQIKHITVAYKIPNIIPYLNKLLSIMPNTRVIVIKRGAIETFHSLIDKGWFKENGPQTMTLWPFREASGIRVPYWVRNGEESLWSQLRELDRCAYYYLRMSEPLPHAPKILQLRYSELLRNPAAFSESLAEWLGLDESELTSQLLATIVPTGKKIDTKILSGLSSCYRDAVLEQSALSE